MLLLLTGYLGYRVEQNDFYGILSCLGPAFLLYYWICFRMELQAGDIRFFIGLGIAMRLLLLPALPALSDDIFRFIWDGRLIAQGINPFGQLPVDYLGMADPPAWHRPGPVRPAQFSGVFHDLSPGLPGDLRHGLPLVSVEY